MRSDNVLWQKIPVAAKTHIPLMTAVRDLPSRNLYFPTWLNARRSCLFATTFPYDTVFPQEIKAKSKKPAAVALKKAQKIEYARWAR
jgi:hypothetical protein